MRKRKSVERRVKIKLRKNKRMRKEKKMEDIGRTRRMRKGKRI